jgi:hypothetical protein
MNCIKGLGTRLAYDADSVDHEINARQSRKPVADAEITREIGGYKRRMLNSGQWCSAGGNYSVTSAAERIVEMLTYETGGTGQQDAHAGSTGS